VAGLSRPVSSSSSTTAARRHPPSGSAAGYPPRQSAVDRRCEELRGARTPLWELRRPQMKTSAAIHPTRRIRHRSSSPPGSGSPPPSSRSSSTSGTSPPPPPGSRTATTVPGSASSLTIRGMCPLVLIGSRRGSLLHGSFFLLSWQIVGCRGRV